MIRRFPPNLTGALLTAVLVVPAIQAQTSAVATLHSPAQANRVAAAADFSPQTQLTGHLPRWVNSSSETAKSVDLEDTLHVSVLLTRSPEVQTAFEQLLASQQDPGSALYHQWLTPQQIGTLYGPTASDLAAVTNWLTAQGLTVDTVAPNGIDLEVSGTVSQVGNAFHTTFGYFNLNGTARLSARTDPSIPTVLTPVIRSIAGLTEVPVEAQNHRSAPVSLQTANPSTGSVTTPDYTSSTSGAHYLTPGDFNLIYDVASVIAGGNTGATIGSTAQHIAIIGRARVDPTSVAEFATNTGLTNSTFNVVVGGTDPGAVCTKSNFSTCSTAGDEEEATLDVERVLGTANGAQTDLVISASSRTQDGVYIAAAYNVNTLLDPVMTISFGSCEVLNGASGVSLWDTLFSSAAAEGISVFVSSDDSGAAGCDSSGTPPAVAKQYANSPNVICVSSYATCVGGTEFNEGTGTYWSSTNASNRQSVLSYIPEGGWNEPTTSSGFEVAASGGGPSIYVPKPSWQTATGVPSDGFRDTPDVAFSAAIHDAYYVCEDDALGPYITAGDIPSTASCAASGGGYFFPTGGTSAAAPSMAGLAALTNTRLGKAQGNFNPVLYKTYNATPAAFHDTTIATSGVTNCTTATPSMCNNSIPGSASLTTGAQIGYALQTGYDLVTGLGSLDVASFLAAQTTTPTITTTTALTVTPNPASTGQTVTLTATVAPASSASAAPTGTVSFYSGTTLIGAAVAVSNNSATATTTFSTAGTYAITAVYSGDSYYIASTSAATSLVVNAAPNFTLSAATPASSYVSGTTTANTDAVTITSLNSFAGTVALSCTTSGVTGATCSVASPVTLTANGTATSSLTISALSGTYGTLTVTITGTSGSLTSSTTVNFTVTQPSFTMTANPAALTILSGSTTASNTSTVTLTSPATTGYTGPVAFACTVGTNPNAAIGNTAGTCSLSASTATIAAGGTASVNVTVNSPLGTAGAFLVTVTGTRSFAGAAAIPDPSTQITATVNGAGFTLSAPAGLAFTSGATTGNTTTSTVTSTNGFAGTVSFSCTLSGSSPAYPPSCAASSVTLAAGGTAVTTVTISSTVKTSANHTPLFFGERSGAVVFASLLCAFGLRRRRVLRALAVAILLAGGLGALSGCGEGGAATTASKSSAGTYTVTLVGTGQTTGAASGVTDSATTSFAVTIN